MKGMISLKNVTKIAFVAAGISAIIKLIDIMREMGIVYIPDGDAGAVFMFYILNKKSRDNNERVLKQFVRNR